jgi:hypothetical protein
MFFELSAQDSAGVQISFKTLNNEPAQLYKVVYLGEINMQGYDSEGYSYQQGILTRKEFISNLPNQAYFKKDSVYSLEIQFKSNSVPFTLKTGTANQQWFIAPPGEKYNKSRRSIIFGTYGIFLSGLTLGTIALINHSQKKFYDRPDWTLDKPKNPNSRYIIPAICSGISVLLVIRGKKLYKKNKPKIERLD